MKNLENMDVFLNFDHQKTAKMPEGPFCQIRAQIRQHSRLYIEDRGISFA